MADRLFAVALLVAGLLGVVGCGSAGGPLAARVSAKSLPIEIGDGHRTVTRLGGKDAPFLFWTADGAQHATTSLLARTVRDGTTTFRLATDDGSRTATIAVGHDARSVHVRYAVSGTPAVAAIGFSMTAPEDAHFLGTGQRERWVDVARTVQPLKVYNGCDSSSPSPFFASTADFGAWVSTTAVGRIAFPGAADDTNFACDLGTPPCSVGAAAAAVRWCFKAASAELTIAVGSLSQILSAHGRAVGLPRAPWLPQLALMKWRDEISGPSQLFDDIRQLRSRGLPIGWVILDNPWEQGSAHSDCYGSLTFDRAKYPDPAGTIAQIHSLGVRFMLWISPQLSRQGCRLPGYPDGWLTGDDETSVRDLTLPAARADFVKRLERLVALGVDGFKGDRGDEVNLEPDRLAGGAGTLEQNALPLLYDQAAAVALASAHGPRYATLFRSAVPGSSAVLPGFVGPDAEQSFNGLQGEIRAAQTAGASGTPVWGSDIGGYSGGTLTPQVFVRWAQFAALTPIFEVGGAGANATFWQLGPAAVEGFRAAATLHYALVPYLYSLAAAASRTGIPVIRALGLTWPADGHAWSSDEEFTVGADLLAAPVDQDGTSSSVYLPAGDWVDVFSGASQQGGATITRTNGPDDFPLYLRRGAAIPFDFRAPAVWSAAWAPDDLLRANRQGWLVALGDGAHVRSVRDRGSVLEAEPGTGGETIVTIRRALRQEQLRVYAQQRVCRVRIGARALPRVPVPALRSARSAWAGWRGALVIKLSAAPRTTRLSLTPCR